MAIDTQTAKIDIDISSALNNLKKLNTELESINKELNETENNLKSFSKSSDISGLVSKFEKLNSELKELDSKVDNIKSSMKGLGDIEISSEFKELNSLLSTTKKEVSNIDASINKLDSLESKMDVDKVVTDVKQLDSTIDSISDINLTTDTAEKEVDSLDDAIETLVKSSKSDISTLDSSFDSLTSSVKNASTNVKTLSSNVLKATSTQQGLSKVTGALGTATTKVTGSMSNSFRSVGASMLAMQSVFQTTTRLIGDSVEKYQELDSTIREVTFQFGGASQGLNDLEISSESVQAGLDNLIDIAHITSFTTQDMADALLDTAKAGYDVETSMGVVSTAMIGADLNGLDLDETVHTVSGTLASFNESLKEVDNPTETFSERLSQMQIAADLTNSDLADLTEGMTYMAPIASNVGVDFESAITTVALLGDAGLEASKGARVLSTGLLNLTAPTASAKSSMEELGIEVYDQQGNILPLIDIIEDLKTSTEGLTDEQRAFHLESIFGKTAIKSWGSILNLPIEQFELVKDAMDESGDSLTYLESKYLETSLAIDPTQIERWNQELSLIPDEAERATRKTEIMAGAMEGLAERNPAKYLEQLRDSLTDLQTQMGGLIAQIIAPEIANAISLGNTLMENLATAMGYASEESGNLALKLGAVLISLTAVMTGVSVLIYGLSLVTTSLPIVATLFIVNEALKELYFTTDDVTILFTEYLVPTFGLLKDGVKTVAGAVANLIKAVLPLVPIFFDLAMSVIPTLAETLGAVINVIAGVVEAMTPLLIILVGIIKVINLLIKGFSSLINNVPLVKGVVVALTTAIVLLTVATKAYNLVTGSSIGTMGSFMKVGGLLAKGFTGLSGVISGLIPALGTLGVTLATVGVAFAGIGLIIGGVVLAYKLLKKTTEEQIDSLESQYRRGLISTEEYNAEMLKLTNKRKHEINDDIEDGLRTGEISEEESYAYREALLEDFVSDSGDVYKNKVADLKTALENEEISYEDYTNKLKELDKTSTNDFEQQVSERRDTLGDAYDNGLIDAGEYYDKLNQLNEEQKIFDKTKLDTQIGVLENALDEGYISQETFYDNIGELIDVDYYKFKQAQEDKRDLLDEDLVGASSEKIFNENTKFYEEELKAVEQLVSDKRKAIEDDYKNGIIDAEEYQDQLVATYDISEDALQETFDGQLDALETYHEQGLIAEANYQKDKAELIQEYVDDANKVLRDQNEEILGDNTTTSQLSDEDFAQVYDNNQQIEANELQVLENERANAELIENEEYKQSELARIDKEIAQLQTDTIMDSAENWRNEIIKNGGITESIFNAMTEDIKDTVDATQDLFQDSFDVDNVKSLEDYNTALEDSQVLLDEIPDGLSEFNKASEDAFKEGIIGADEYLQTISDNTNETHGLVTKFTSESVREASALLRNGTISYDEYLDSLEKSGEQSSQAISDVYNQSYQSLQDTFSEGIISEQEYYTNSQTLRDQQLDDINTMYETQTTNLKSNLNDGIISQEEYNTASLEIWRNLFADRSELYQTDKDSLQEQLDNKYISEEDYNTKVSALNTEFYNNNKNMLSTIAQDNKDMLDKIYEDKVVSSDELTQLDQLIQDNFGMTMDELATASGKSTKDIINDFADMSGNALGDIGDLNNEELEDKEADIDYDDNDATTKLDDLNKKKLYDKSFSVYADTSDANYKLSSLANRSIASKSFSVKATGISNVGLSGGNLFTPQPSNLNYGNRTNTRSTVVNNNYYVNDTTTNNISPTTTNNSTMNAILSRAMNK